MSLILNIETALGKASICLAENGESLGFSEEQTPKTNTAWLHTATAGLLQQNGVSAQQLDAIAVSIGPGSYTGLRVGLAAAKGLCYALQIPLIAVDTLKMMALAVKEQAADLICPMIDARRMEVFTAIYNSTLRERISPQAMVIDDKSFSSILVNHSVLFCGSGASKFRSLTPSNNATFTETRGNAIHVGKLSTISFNEHAFADLAYTAPFYLKEFYTPAHK
jgi:tRNA threonylcarbamoyladenosine biosynthesis protein TsaB